MARFLATLVLLVVIVFGVAWAFGFVSLRQTREASLPHVNVSGGQSPKFDVQVANVTVGKKEVDVPTVNVQKPAH